MRVVRCAMVRRWIPLILAVVSACGSAPAVSGPRPVATLTDSTDVAREWVELREAWQTPTPAWVAIRLRLERFIDRFPSDATTPLARLYLANALVALGEIAGAEEQLAQAGVMPAAGTMTDLSVVTRARILRAKKDPDAALGLLRPLVGKAVDPVVLDLVAAETVLSAVDSHRDYEAIAYMDAWLRDVGEENTEGALARIEAVLWAMDPVAVEGSLRAMRANPDSGASMALMRKMASRLARYAADNNDAQLAQWLLDGQGGSRLVSGADADSLKDLATSLRGKRTITGRTIGLVLPTATPELRDAAADVTRGVAFALDLPRRGAAEGDGARLVTRTQGGGDTLVAAFEELVGEGASVMLAGIDDGSSASVREWSEKNGVPVITLGHATLSTERFSFEVGDPIVRSLSLLAFELTSRHVKTAAVLAGTMETAALKDVTVTGLSLSAPLSCDPPISRATLPREAWAAAHLRALLVTGSDACARIAMTAVPSGAIVALGPRAAAGALGSTNDVKALVVASGAFPFGAPGARQDDRLVAYRGAFGHSPTWWTALGYDAAVLARRAVSALPLDTTTDDAEIRRRRETARAGIEAARASLWTTEAKGFEAGSHSLVRDLRVVELPIVRER